jgi:inosine-uridine nucleoside N-ribohydrolase
MTKLWVDTDFGFDDLWALLLLRHNDIQIAGISLVAGNTPLKQVEKNALGAAQAYGFEIQIWSGADLPLKRNPETAERILGPRGMQSRGLHLPEIDKRDVQPGAISALATWLYSAHANAPREVLALGPLTNIAKLVRIEPEAAHKISRLIWMGGSDGPGNHTAAAEFNALADPDAVQIVADAGIPMDVVDLMVCRQVTFGMDDLPDTDDLSADLLGGYLDIGLSRGRSGMAIYDPTAAMAAINPSFFDFEPRRLEVTITSGETCGATRFIPAVDTRTRLAVRPQSGLAKMCLDAFSKEQTYVD